MYKIIKLASDVSFQFIKISHSYEYHIWIHLTAINNCVENRFAFSAILTISLQECGTERQLCLLLLINEDRMCRNIEYIINCASNWKPLSPSQTSDLNCSPFSSFIIWSISNCNSQENFRQEVHIKFVERLQRVWKMQQVDEQGLS